MDRLDIWVKGVPPALSGQELRRRAVIGDARTRIAFWSSVMGGMAHMIHRRWIKAMGRHNGNIIIAQYDDYEDLSNQGFWLYEEGTW